MVFCGEPGCWPRVRQHSDHSIHCSAWHHCRHQRLVGRPHMHACMCVCVSFVFLSMPVCLCVLWLCLCAFVLVLYQCVCVCWISRCFVYLCVYACVFAARACLRLCCPRLWLASHTSSASPATSVRSDGGDGGGGVWLAFHPFSHPTVMVTSNPDPHLRCLTNSLLHPSTRLLHTNASPPPLHTPLSAVARLRGTRARAAVGL